VISPWVTSSLSSCRQRCPCGVPCGCERWCGCAGREPAGCGGGGIRDLDQALDVQADLLAEVALDLAFLLDDGTNLVELVFVQRGHLGVRVNAGLIENLQGAGLADAIDVRERDASLLVGWQVDAGNTCHGVPFGWGSSDWQRAVMIVMRLTWLLSPPGSSHALTSANSPGGAAFTVRDQVSEIRDRIVRCFLISVLLPLTLLVLGVLADNANDTATVNHLALIADRLYGCTDLH
jgi:hypothetical protein